MDLSCAAEGLSHLLCNWVGHAPFYSLSEFFEPDLHDPEPDDSHICIMTCSTATDQGDKSVMDKKGFRFSPQTAFANIVGLRATCLVESDFAHFRGVGLDNL